MITLVHGHEAEHHQDILDQMYRLRARAFSDRLGWDVDVADGRERDRFDDLDPLYVIALTDDRRVVGSARLLQTTGPTMLSEVFKDLLPTGQSIRSPIVWESTRFCVDTSDPELRANGTVSRCTGELMCSEIEIGLMSGLSHIVTVVDVRMERILRRGGCPIERIGTMVRYGMVPTLAVLIDVSEGSLASIRRANAIDYACVDTTLSNGLVRAA